MSDKNNAAGLALVADIGGTNSRFALARDGVLIPASIQCYTTAAFASLALAARHYLDAQGARVGRGCVAIAGPVAGDYVHLTNCPWQFSIEQTRLDLNLQHLRVLNDFQAVGLALPHLQPAQLEQIGAGDSVAGWPRVALGPGTGYGATHVIEADGTFVALPTEGGHVSIAPANALEIELCQWLLDHDLQIICEHLLSGPGLENIYRALAAIHGRGNQRKTAAAIQQAAVEGSDDLSVASLQLFCELLGTAARDQALSCLARGGVYIAGGIVQRFIPFLRNSQFRQRFEFSPTMHEILRPIPVYVITGEFAGLVGAAAQCR